MHRFEQIYQDNRDYVRRTLFWLIHRDAKDSIDDLVQEVFVKVWRSLSKFEGKSSVKTWIYRITVNTAYDYMKGEKNMAVSAMIDPPPENRTVDHDLFIKDVIHRGIQILNPKQRIVFVLHYKEALSLDEISESLSLPKGTVKSRLFNAREQFGDFLRRNGVSYE